MTETGRTWNSTCGDCVHFEELSCEMRQTGRDKDDLIAAVCRDFKNKEKTEGKSGRENSDR